MKFLLCFILFTTCFLLTPKIVFADQVPTPTAIPTPTIPPVTTAQSANMIVGSLKTFIGGIDSWLGGFIFHTPDLFGTNIVLQDGTDLGAIANFRDMFYLISIPLIAIVIAFSALHIINAENSAIIKPFLLRLLLVGVMLIITPLVFSYSIQANNLLVDKILATSTTSQSPQFTGFITDYLDNVTSQVSKGADPGLFGIPSFNFSVLQNPYSVIGVVLVRLLLFLVLILALLSGIFFILFQFIMRFLSLLFLSVLFPLAIPFTLSPKTQNITKSYFQAWFSFLIHQPAFVLAYMLVISILKTTLAKNGASLGTLLLYIGSLFFLGGVSAIAARIFGQPWTAIANDAQAFLATRSIMGNITEFKRGMVGGSVTGIKSLAGTKLAQRIGLLPRTTLLETQAKNSSTSGENNKTKGTQEKTSSSQRGTTTYEEPTNGFNAPASPSKHSFTKELQQHGMQTRLVDQKQGIVSIDGEGYKHTDKATGLTSIYPTKADGVADGIAEKDLKPTRINRANFIDLSSFGKEKNPHNAFVTAAAKNQGHASNYAHLTPTSSPDRVKNFLTIAKERNSERDIKGVIVKRFGNSKGERTKERIVRLYTTEEL